MYLLFSVTTWNICIIAFDACHFYWPVDVEKSNNTYKSDSCSPHIISSSPFRQTESKYRNLMSTWVPQPITGEVLDSGLGFVIQSQVTICRFLGITIYSTVPRNCTTNRIYAPEVSCLVGIESSIALQGHTGLERLMKQTNKQTNSSKVIIMFESILIRFRTLYPSNSTKQTNNLDQTLDKVEIYSHDGVSLPGPCDYLL